MDIIRIIVIFVMVSGVLLAANQIIAESDKAIFCENNSMVKASSFQCYDESNKTLYTIISIGNEYKLVKPN